MIDARHPPRARFRAPGAWIGIAAAFVMSNLIVFASHRLLFLDWFAGGVEAAPALSVLAAGARLDAALLSFELAGLGALALLFGNLRYRRAAVWIGALTLAHALACAVSLYSYQERGQQLGEILAPYVTQPALVYMAAKPFVIDHWPLVASILAGLGALFAAVAWMSRRLPPHEMAVRSTARRAAGTVLLSALPILGALEIVTVKRTNRESGWSLKFTHSKFYALFPSFALNQAVENPIHELFRVYLPAAFRSSQPFTLSEGEALEITHAALGREVEDAAFPLLTTLRSDVDLGLENVVLIQIEGLSSTVADRVEDGRTVMPFLQRLRAEGLWFPNTFQSFNATSGSVFATATGMPHTCFDEVTHRFATYEMKGRYGSLPNILGNELYDHYFCLASRHSAQDFPAFFRTQGYVALGYAEFSARVRDRRLGPESEDALGVVDGAFLDECAEVILASRRRVNLHIVTNTSHSPWKAPAAFGTRFANPYLNVFAYVDSSLEAFFDKLRARYHGFDRTLFVVVSDHTSVMVGDDLLERLRVPLVFWSSNMGALRAKCLPELAAAASHVDIVPTVLWLLGGERKAAAMGRSLLDPRARAPGVLSGTSFAAYYLRGDAILHHAPGRGETRLFQRRAGRAVPVDPADHGAGAAASLRQEMLAQYETAKRLGAARRVWP